MGHSYLLFDFGTDEDKAQQARHKLESWKQAFRLDKKLQFKFDRGSADTVEAPPPPAKAEKPKSKTKAQPKTAADVPDAKNGDVKLLVRLYFSPHEKLSEQRWFKQIPSEEPFKGAAPRLIQEGEADFAEVLAQFDRLD